MCFISRCLCRQCGKPKPPGGELSAEDQEVFSITVGSQRPTITSTASLATPQSGLCTACTHPQPHSHSRCESKSSKQSLSSACTQLTSLSPEEEVGAYEGRHSHDHAHGHPHGHGVMAGQWESGCVQCAQEAALLTSQLAGQESSDRQRVFGYPYLGYSAYEGYPAYSDCQTGVGVSTRSGQRTPSSVHYGTPGAHFGAAAQHSHYAPSHYRSHYAAHGSHYGAPHSQGVYYGSQSSHYYPGHQYASQAPYGGASTHYRSTQSSHYGAGVQQSSGQQHSPVTLSLSASSSSSQPGMSLKLNRSVSHESGSMYPACASPRGPDYAPGSSQKSASRSPNRSLIPLVTTKLSAEGIILTDEPYSTPVSSCPGLFSEHFECYVAEDLKC